LLRDVHGNTKVLGIRDCSVQRDKQKVIEESGSTMLPDRLLGAVLKHTAALADEVGYVGVGTVEFIYDLAADAVYFMEMNTRLQVEHPVTEWVSGVDIVSEQFRIASGESIADLAPRVDGYAIEARINAERVQTGPDGNLVFRPQPGQIGNCVFPSGEGTEVIAMAKEGKFVSPYYDSMIAQVIVHAADRAAAIEKLLTFLDGVRIDGICTNIPLLERVLRDEVFRAGEYNTDYLPDLLRRTDTATLIKEIEAAAGQMSGGINKESIRIEDSDELRVLSPATAIFYTTPTPTESEYVAVGDHVSVSDTIGQLEAMKIFTPLSLADFNGEFELYDPNHTYEVTRINMTSGQQVNVGDLLFVVKPLTSA
jgi:acetyl/propionyl-CoA carboxylase alpha subunit